MAELRWTLLGLGALFVLGLLLWERYKRSRANAAATSLPPASLPSASLPSASKSSLQSAPNAPVKSPSEARKGAVTPARPLPIIDLDEAQERSGTTTTRAPHCGARADSGDGSGDDLGVNLGADPKDEEGGEFVRQPLASSDPTLRGMRVESMTTGTDAASRAEQWIAAAGMRTLRSEDLVVQWPADDQRSIVALRVEARGSARIGGRTLRQALLGEGFVFGKFDIFHLPLADGRVIISAASLTKPGGFALATMDAQTFLGLNLFAVLPGALAAEEALERLIASGRLLAQRLDADLLDDQGRPLSESLLTDMRARLAATSRAAPPRRSDSGALRHADEDPV